MSPEDLLKGTFYALEQCGLLLRDANILYRSGSAVAKPAASVANAAYFAKFNIARILIGVFDLSGPRRRDWRPKAPGPGTPCGAHDARASSNTGTVRRVPDIAAMCAYEAFGRLDRPFGRVQKTPSKITHRAL
jgi:hypothetical protein